MNKAQIKEYLYSELTPMPYPHRFISLVYRLINNLYHKRKSLLVKVRLHPTFCNRYCLSCFYTVLMSDAREYTYGSFIVNILKFGYPKMRKQSLGYLFYELRR